MKDSVPKLFATVSVWASLACIFVFGICKMTWSTDTVVMMFMIISITLSLSAMGATAMIWRDKKGGPPGPGAGV